MNKEQIKHLAEMLREIAIAQFVYFCGYNVTIKGDFDWFMVGFSVVLYGFIHVMIHCILSDLED